MVQGMSRDAWDEFSETMLVRYVLLYLCGTFFLDPSASLKKIFAFSVEDLFGLSTHAFNLPEKITNNDNDDDLRISPWELILPYV